MAPSLLHPHRGRIQAQGNSLEKSVSWAQSLPVTQEEGLAILSELTKTLSKREKGDRKTSLLKASRFIERAGKAGGVDAPVSKTFLEPHSKENRIDIEVIAGRAFIPD
ncbi:MAG: hypothetical protein AB8F95_14800 [Bacteroidia bacterium]